MSVQKYIIYTFFSDDDFCPVRTFLHYKSKLSKKCAYFFQRVSSFPKEDCWYDSIPTGHNILGSMMVNISKECLLSKLYTNHSLRATTVHVLDCARFPDRHIMSVTGHKAESSLKTYTGFTDTKTKQKMSATLSNVLRDGVEVKQNKLPDLDPGRFNLLPLTNSQEDWLIQDMETDTNVDDILQSLDIPNVDNNSVVHTPSTSVNNVMMKPNNFMNMPSINFPNLQGLNLQSNASNVQSFGGLPFIQNYGHIHINYNILPK